MKLAYLTIFDATDVLNWSGLDLHIWRSLVDGGVDIELIGNLWHQPSLMRRVRKFWSTRIENKNFLHLWDVDTARGYGADAEARIKALSVDAVLSPSPIPLAYLKCDKPIFLWTDAPFAGLLDFYPEFSRKNLSSASVRSGLTIDRLALERCTLAFFTSDWAARTAVERHGVPPNKVKVVPFGANISHELTLDQIETLIEARPVDRFRLLFLGVDWERKGGPIALETAIALHNKGMNIELIIVGCDPPRDQSLPPFVRCEGFLNKATESGKAQLQRLLSESHILIVPSLAEAYGLVFAEAHAFGVPCVATNVGGIPSIVSDGITGKLFRLEEPAESWANWLCDLFADRARYKKMALDSFHRYRERLNWRVCAEDVIFSMQQKIGNAPSLPPAEQRDFSSL